MEDLPIGSEIVLKVVESEKEECNGCFFDEISSNIYENVCGDFVCSAKARKDGKNVQFKSTESSIRLADISTNVTTEVTLVRKAGCI